MSEAPRFSSLIVSRPRRALFPAAPLAAFLLALGAYVLAAVAILISHVLFVELMQPARVQANDNPLPVFKALRNNATTGDPSLGPARFGLPRAGGGEASRAADRVTAPRRPSDHPQPLAPPETYRPPAQSHWGEGDLQGIPGGTDRRDAFPDGNCLQDCGEGTGGGPGPTDGPPDGVFSEADPRLDLPRLIEASRVLPDYPEIARRAHLQGSVLLKIIVRADGSVGAIEVMQSPDPRLGFDLAAIEAVKQWRYEPARMSAVPVSVQMLVMVEFVISR